MTGRRRPPLSAVRQHQRGWLSLRDGWFTAPAPAPSRARRAAFDGKGGNAGVDEAVSAHASCALFSFEPGQELAKGFCTGPFGAFYRRIVIASQSDRKWLAIAINLPSPAPRIWVRLLHREMVSSVFQILRLPSDGKTAFQSRTE